MSLLWTILFVALPLSLEVSSDFVTAHNQKRSLTGASNMKKLRFSPELQLIAQAHASRCEYKNNPDASTLSKTFKDVGENIHKTSISWSNFLKEKGVVTDWGKESTYYRYATNTCTSSSCERYKQIVRAETEFIGCGQAHCEFGMFTVCNYAPRGNSDEVPYMRGGRCNNCTAGYSCDTETDGLCSVPC